MKKLFVLLLFSYIVMANSLTQSEILYFSTTKKTVNNNSELKKDDTQYIKGYWQNRIDTVSNYAQPKSKTEIIDKEEKVSMYDQYLDTLKTQDYKK